MESINGTNTIELNTNILPIFQPDYYGSAILDDYNCTVEDADIGTMKIGESIIADALNRAGIKSEVNSIDVYHPKYYNYETDALYFTVTFNTASYESLKAQALENPAFKIWLKDRYSSRSGFISYMADNIEDFKNQDLDYSFAQVAKFYIGDTSMFQEMYDDEMAEYLYNNFERVDYD